MWHTPAKFVPSSCFWISSRSWSGVVGCTASFSTRSAAAAKATTAAKADARTKTQADAASHAAPPGSAAPPEVVAEEEDVETAAARAQLVAFYQKHNPEKLGEVDGTLKKFTGRFPTLFKKLKQKYGVK